MLNIHEITHLRLSESVTNHRQHKTFPIQPTPSASKILFRIPGICAHKSKNRKNGNPLATLLQITPSSKIMAFFGNTLATLFQPIIYQPFKKRTNHENRNILQQFNPFREQILFPQHRIRIIQPVRQTKILLNVAGCH